MQIDKERLNYFEKDITIDIKAIRLQALCTHELI